MNKHKKFNSILYRIVFAVLVLVLFSSHFSSGIAAKFLSSAEGSDSGRVARFSCSTNIDAYSALTFTNTAFWGGAYGDSGVAMNALRSVNFSVHNWDYAEGSSTEKIVNEVASSYELNFSAPANFIEKLAIQVFDDQDHPLMPQFGFHDLIETFHESTGTTEIYTAPAMAKYNGKLFHHDVPFSVTKTGSADSGFNYVATSNTPDTSTEGLTVKLTKFQKVVDQTLFFRLWDVSNVTTSELPSVSNEMGKLLAPLQLVLERDVEFYKISVSLPNFVLKTGEAETKQYKIQIAPTHALMDDHLGAILSVSTASSSFVGEDEATINKDQNIKASSWMETIIDEVDGQVVAHNEEAVINPQVPTDTEPGSPIKNVSSVTETLTEDVTLHDVKKNGEGAVEDVTISQGSVVETITEETQEITNTVNVTDTDTEKSYTQTVRITTQKTYNVTSGGEITTYVYTSTQNVNRTITYTNHTDLSLIPKCIKIPELNAQGEVIYETDGSVKYREVNSFDLFEKIDGVTKQKYFISECYSKNYAMSVSVTFTQID